MTDTEHTFPEIHKPLLEEIFQRYPCAPRWVIATELAKRAHITKDTALEYMNYALKEGLVHRVGLNLRISTRKPDEAV